MLSPTSHAFGMTAYPITPPMIMPPAAHGRIRCLRVLFTVSIGKAYERATSFCRRERGRPRAAVAAARPHLELNVGADLPVSRALRLPLTDAAATTPPRERRGARRRVASPPAECERCDDAGLAEPAGKARVVATSVRGATLT